KEGKKAHEAAKLFSAGTRQSPSPLESAQQANKELVNSYGATARDVEAYAVDARRAIFSIGSESETTAAKTWDSVKKMADYWERYVAFLWQKAREAHEA